ncbi:hypothetical protein C9374_001768 [Naegleria lovaniensis]|uniref:Uncharacterized protein n=1 Tax=Naegleria lovaniensis TaxID=51637 RepID=A0AA88GS85_NAELO|nr:uncharacterized protein C9374_001768 [Naegleria lovaniensis]KAG2387436.1 hypothetical protein C9374_001768 [Naegleria lovaniensis]
MLKLIENSIPHCCSFTKLSMAKKTKMNLIHWHQRGFWRTREFSQCFRYLRKDNSEFENSNEQVELANVNSISNNESNGKESLSELNQVKTHAERQQLKIPKKRNQLMETVQKYKTLNQQIVQKQQQPPKKKKKNSLDITEEKANWRFLNNMDAHIIKHMKIKDADADELPPSYSKEYEIGKNRRTNPYHIEERNFTVMKPKTKKIKKGESKEIKKARKMLDEDEKHLKPEKPRF